MASLQAPSFLSSSSSCCNSKAALLVVRAAIPKLPIPPPNSSSLSISPSSSKLPSPKLFRELNGFSQFNYLAVSSSPPHAADDLLASQLYAVLEIVADRVEMHRNIADQRDNWNTLLLNSLNAITLAASAMSGVAAAAAAGDGGAPLLALKLSSALLFTAATGMLVIMNKIQPSQLAEEQRNAARLFRQLGAEIETVLAVRKPRRDDVEDAMAKVLALDKAYPLPLLGAMLEKFPEKFEAATWWPTSSRSHEKSKISNTKKMKNKRNGWSEGLEMELKEVMEVAKRKDGEDYERLGNMVLKVNKCLAVAGPLLTGIAAVGSAFIGEGPSWGAVVPAVAGAVATAVNGLEHGGQVGMVAEMYRYCGGFFEMLEDSVEEAIREEDAERRENGELFEMKVALKLGRSLSQLRDLAKKSAYSRTEGVAVDEFASKLF